MHLHNAYNKLFLLSVFISIANMLHAQQINPEIDKLIHYALTKDHKLTYQELEVQKAQLDSKLAKNTFIPTFTFNASYTRLDENITFDENTLNLLSGARNLLVKESIGVPFGNPLPDNVPLPVITPIQDKNVYKSSIDMEWVLFSGMVASNAAKASEHKAKSLAFQTLSSEDKLAMEIFDAYHKLALIYASEKVIETTSTYLDKQQEYVHKAIKNGLATPIDRRKIALATQQLETKKLEVDHNRSLLIEQLAQLTGMEKGRLKKLRPTLDSTLIEVGERVKRNELKALEEGIRANEYKARMEESKILPKVAMRGHYELLDESLTLLDPRWYIGIGLKWNFFDGNKSNIESQKSQIDAEIYREKYLEAEELINLSIIKAEKDFQLARQKANTIVIEIELASETMYMVEKQYINGIATITEYLDSVNDLEKAHFRHQQALYDMNKSFINLQYAKGVLNYKK